MSVLSELGFLRGLIAERDGHGGDIPVWLALEWVDETIKRVSVEMIAPLTHDQHYECNHCDWDGPRDETVHPKHNATLLLCPKCHETLCAVEQPSSNPPYATLAQAIQRIQDEATKPLHVEIEQLNAHCRDLSEQHHEALDEIERLRKLMDGRTFVTEDEREDPCHPDYVGPVEPTDGYREAFYEISKLLDLPAMPISPKEAFETVMLPKLRELMNRPVETNEHCVAPGGE